MTLDPLSSRRQNPEQLDRREADPRFEQELKTAVWLQHQVRFGDPLPVLEAEAVTHSLHLALGQEGPSRIPQLPLQRMSEYTAVHAVNVALLAIALGEHVGLDAADARAVGLAALLHDIGMARVPVELLAKAEQLAAEEREVIRQHPAEGARIIIEANASLELPAIVAFEHHRRVDGGGYPELRFPSELHYVTRLVQVCDVYHALHSPRPFRQPWPQDIIFSFLLERSGTEFDGEMAAALAAMLRRRLQTG